MLRKLIVLTRWLVLAALVLSGCGACSEVGVEPELAAPVANGSEEEEQDSFVSLGALPAALGDLDEVRERGTLRVLVDGTEASFVSSKGRSASTDRDLIRRFALKQDLQVQFVLVDSFENLFEALKNGYGDLIAADLTITPKRAEQVAFTRPTAVSEELLVARKSAGPHPDSLQALAGKKITVPVGSSYEETLKKLIEEHEVDVEIVTTQRDVETLSHELARGHHEYSVLDSHLFEAISAYDDRLVALFPLATGKQIAWALRKESPKLKASLDAFLIEDALTSHSRHLFTGDLEEIKKRGSIRVLTRNNPVTYFLYRGERMGFDYQLVQMMADELGLRLEMVVPPSRDQLIPWLLEGKGDLIAASLTITPERASQITFSRPYLLVEEWLVQRDSEERLESLADLKGKRIHVRRSSSYFNTLRALQADYGPFEIVEMPEELETEILIDQLAEGEIDYTVADSHILQVEQTYRSNLVGAFPLPALPESSPAAKARRGEEREREDEAGLRLAVAREGLGAAAEESASEKLVDEEPVLIKDIAFGTRPENPELLAWVDDFVKRHYRGLEYNMARRRYFENSRTISRAKTERVEISGQISPYDDLIRRYSSQYGLDWRLMAALAYQESRFNPQAESWVGAKGLFQVMPTTGKSLGFMNLEDPVQGTHAGIRYVDWLLHQLEPELPFKQRIRFALASYNAGLGHVNDARRLASELELDPDRWFGNVEKAMLLLQQPQYYKRARHGYVRGSEPVKYVSQIQLRYDNWVRLLPE